MIKFYIYYKVAGIFDYTIGEAESLDAMAMQLKVCKACWKIGKVMGHRRVKLVGMPHASAILINDSKAHFIAIEYATNAKHSVARLTETK